MEIREIVPGYAVSPQIDPQDVPQIKAAGYTVVICNRPDGEVPEMLQAAAVEQAVRAAGLGWVVNPLTPGVMTEDNIRLQRETVENATGPVFAYCASGNRSTICWALGQAGKRPTDELVALGARWGYRTPVWRDRIEARARG